MKALATIENKEIKERIINNIFHPILENNKTVRESSDNEEEIAKQEHYHRHVDGGKLPPKTVREIKEILDTKYIFSAFNILIYAQNYVLKMASQEGILEANRDEIYKLYDYAIMLEPKPDREELTFTQQQLVNKARNFVTLKMKRRQNLRDQKAEVKNMIRSKKIASETIMEQQDLV